MTMFDLFPSDVYAARAGIEETALLTAQFTKQ